MSVNIWIENDDSQTVIDEFDCICVCPMSGPKSDCPDCAGKGKISVVGSEFEINLANANFCAIWRALGLDFDYSGSVHPERLLAAIQSADPGTINCCGTTIQYVKERFHQIKMIAVEAKLRNQMVVWG